MTGIAGWMDLTGGGAGRDRAGRMIAALAHRGSDLRSIWQDDQAAIAFCGRALAASPGQPAVAREGLAGAVVLAFDGWLANLAELRRDLAARGRPGAASEADCLLQAYLEWGQGVAGRLAGEYACAIWDGRTRELLLIRDRLGVRPLYYAPVPGGVLFGSEPTAIFAHGLIEPVCDAEGFRELLAPARAPAASIWRGLAEVPNASLVLADGSGCHAAPYWELHAGPARNDLPAAADALRSLLAEIVGRHLTGGLPDGLAGCLLSGGLDSSVMVALAARHAAARGVAVRTHTIDFDSYVANFVPDSARPTPDAPFARLVAEHAGTDHYPVVLDVDTLTSSASTNATWSASDRLPSQCDLTRALYSFYEKVSGTSPVVLSGEGADELLGMGVIADPSAPEETFPWLSWMRGVPRFSVLRPEIERRLEMEDHIARLHEAALAQCPGWPGDTPADARMRESIYLYTLHDMARTLERADRLGALAGVEVRMPFLDHRVIELTFGVGYQPHTHDGQEKSLLRTAAAGLLPESVLGRKKSNLPTPQDAAYDAAVSKDYHDLLQRPGEPIFELANHQTLAWLGRDLGGRTSALYLRRMREDALALNCWLSVHGAALRL